MGIRRARRSRRRGRLVERLRCHRKPIANTWQGIFPIYNTNEDGYAGTAPVGCFYRPNSSLERVKIGRRSRVKFGSRGP
jgi:hypothetical protein